MAEITLTKENFESEVIHSELPVLVDFWAEWCGPCRMIAPTVEEIANEYEGKVKVGKINVDKESELAIRYHIDAIPALLIFKNGAVVETRKGLRPKSELCALLDQMIQ
ncbi:MAG: thioredoxin [Clostridia bacterium]|nr:thioredoxin [Clostridia bacterium]